MRKLSFFVLLFCFLTISVSYASTIPHTGQTMCYDENNQEVLCDSIQPGDPYYGQDGHYQPHLPRSYTKLGHGGVELADNALHADDGGPWIMTRDNVTGLIWEIKTNSNRNDKYIWSNAQDIFITDLNKLGFGGFSDWRLPEIKELSSLANRGVYNPAIDNTWFPKTMSSDYLSSTTDASSNKYVWGVSFSNGYVQFCGYKYQNSYYVRAVRSGSSWEFDNFIDNGDGTITDQNTGLIWQKATAPGKYNWRQALEYAENLTLAGYSDWRLPNVNELQTLVDYSNDKPASYPVFRPHTLPWYYWSSTTAADNTSLAWRVSFYSGFVGYYTIYKSDRYHVRAVRSGQSVIGQLGSLVVHIEPAEARDAGAKWRRIGSSYWHKSGEIESDVSVGEHIIEFKDISGWLTPKDLLVKVAESQNTEVTGIYLLNDSQCNNLKITDGKYSETDNLIGAVQSEFGKDSTIVDWSDLKAISNIGSWINCMNLENNQVFMVTKNGNYFYGTNRQYFVKYFASGQAPSNWLVHDKIDNKLFLGSWYGLNMPILAKVPINDNSQSEMVLNWAEQLLPDMLPANGKTVYSENGLYVRYYPETGICLGTYQGRLLYYDPSVSPYIIDLGSLNAYVGMAQEYFNNVNKPKFLDGWYTVTVENLEIPEKNAKIDCLHVRFYPDEEAEVYIYLKDSGYLYHSNKSETSYRYIPDKNHFYIWENGNLFSLSGVIQSGVTNDFYLSAVFCNDNTEEWGDLYTSATFRLVKEASGEKPKYGTPTKPNPKGPLNTGWYKGTLISGTSEKDFDNVRVAFFDDGTGDLSVANVTMSGPDCPYRYDPDTGYIFIGEPGFRLTGHIISGNFNDGFDFDGKLYAPWHPGIGAEGTFYFEFIPYNK